ncbi:MAG TPA: hypothetical protein VG165_13435 [Solirubrobacteraceae bacterium]|nr:hypothetical protein [Solirubrobacteraceae bacterium]
MPATPDIASGPPGGGFHPHPPGNPIVPVALPGLAIQFRAAGALSPQETGYVVSSVKSVVTAYDPNAQAVAVTRDPTSSDAADVVGVWLAPPFPTPAQAQPVVAELPSLTAQETFGIFISEGLIDLITQKTFAALPKVLGSGGDADPDGPTHLTGISVTLAPPSTVQTFVTGFDTRPVPDASFTLTVTDVLSADITPRHVGTENLSIDRSWLDEIEGVLFGSLFLSIFWWPFALAFLAFDIELIGVLLELPPAPQVGGAGAAALSMLPTAVPLPKDGDAAAQTLTFLYETVEVLEGGIYASGLNGVRGRDPGVQIAGPATLTLQTGSSAQASFSAVGLSELRAPVSYRWSAAGAIHNQGSSLTGIEFSAKVSTPGSVQTTDVSLTVTDTDGVTATAVHAVGLQSVLGGVHKPGFPDGPGS